MKYKIQRIDLPQCWWSKDCIAVGCKRGWMYLPTPCHRQDTFTIDELLVEVRLIAERDNPEPFRIHKINDQHEEEKQLINQFHHNVIIGERKRISEEIQRFFDKTAEECGFTSSVSDIVPAYYQGRNDMKKALLKILGDES